MKICIEKSETTKMETDFLLFFFFWILSNWQAKKMPAPCKCDITHTQWIGICMLTSLLIQIVDSKMRRSIALNVTLSRHDSI